MNPIDKAIQYAAVAHQGQTRKGTDIPYVVHVYAVGMLLARHGYGEEIIIAGLLHDTVEDTRVTLGDLTREFGPKVASIVEGCSEPDRTLAWEERKKHTLEYLRKAPDEVRFVACADKLHNISCMLDDYGVLGDKLWTRFNRGKADQAWYYQGLVKSLSDGQYFPMIEDFKAKVDVLFNAD